VRAVEAVVDSGSDFDAEAGRRPPQARTGSNVILVGGMGAGKSTVGWLLARLIGYGFIDVDRAIETRERKTVDQIFESKGESYFREREREAVEALSGIRTHVIAVGGGALSDDVSWEVLQRLGVQVWLNPPSTELARRLAADPAALARRPLLADLLTHKDKEMRHKLLSERISALVGNRADRYKQAQLVVTDSFSTPEATARTVRAALTRDGVLRPNVGEPIDRWRLN
jgi:shikimate kinase